MKIVKGIQRQWQPIPGGAVGVPPGRGTQWSDGSGFAGPERRGCQGEGPATLTGPPPDQNNSRRPGGIPRHGPGSVALSHSFLLAFLIMGLISCSGSTEIRVDIDIASNITSTSGDLLEEIEAQRQAGISRGIHFVFTPLKCPPVTVDDVDTALAEFSQPDLTVTGQSPVSSSYKIGTKSLVPNTYYRIQMRASTASNPPVVTHLGTGDCPINVSLGESLNQTTICFGDFALAGIGPLCPDTLPFAECPSVKSSAQVCP